MSLARRRLPVVLVVLGLAAALFMALLSPIGASSHREAPLITEDPVADNTDVYAWMKGDNMVVVANWIPLEEPAGGPNFFKFGDDVLYEINIDNDGDAKDDVVYEFRFTTKIKNPNTFLYNTGPIETLDDADWNMVQTYTVSEVKNGRRTKLGSGLFSPPEQHRSQVDPQLRGPGGAGRLQPSGRDQGLRRSARRGVPGRPGVDLRPRRSAAAQQVPPAATRRRVRRSTPQPGTTSTPS